MKVAIRKIKRRTRAIGAFPDRASALRLGSGPLSQPMNCPTGCGGVCGGVTASPPGLW